MARKYDQNIKLLLIGDSGVGKTCLMLRYAQGTFSETFITTVGIDYKYKFIEIDGKKVRLEIWDTAGQERFKAITRSYLRGAQGILCVYDVTDSNSYEHVSSWMLQIKQYADLKVVKVLVGNKCDLEQRRAVKFEDGQNLAKKSDDIPFFECSAKQETNVKEAFETLAREVLKKNDRAEPAKSSGVKVTDQPSNNNGQQKGCCK
mmetsp:Transcript_46959/g.69514  ORF Transcript_46959/g.69514 Transcript_46959/m.69514 type:complete len:204 (-) Transcript_46959:134-745(-)|eukprot:CAMPEP_0195516782 /NCGR_PEP_ID=MMETSP0794_2-20130614/8644_1 /TAXON_ID=515487 /ORGANISM="Stephanopyxis turris, Strain CCMP 815" /LENGTH=203 /DNA_ID=CAMNT_0040645465 /DNA_START=100 /DNA_END=711 /DNA_ORIENTATION=+